MTNDTPSPETHVVTDNTYQVNKIIRRYLPDVPAVKHCLRDGEDRMLIEEISVLRKMLAPSPQSREVGK